MPASLFKVEGLPFWRGAFVVLAGGALAAPLNAGDDGKSPAPALPEVQPLSPTAWGNLDVLGFLSSKREAPNGGVPFHPLVASRLDLNLQMLPAKELYFFSETEFWTQHRVDDAPVTSSDHHQFSNREYDLYAGIAWEPWQDIEFRGAFYANNNLNRGTSASKPYGFNDGVEAEARYYFGKASRYDDGRLSFIGIGYAPTKTLIGGDGVPFKPGFFARAYATYDLPFLGSYLYADVRYMTEKDGASKLLELDAGLALRPFERLPNVELRVGDDVTRDIPAGTTRNLIYGSVRINFGSDEPKPGAASDGKQAEAPPAKGPSVWGDFEIPFSFTGTRMAPNGVAYSPLFAANLDLNIALLPDKELYLFTDTELWGQRAAPGVTNKSQGSFDFSKREFDLDYGVAWNFYDRFELRGSLYAMDNLNRGNSLTSASGVNDGGQFELRRYFGEGDPYDVGRLSFFSIGDAPSKTLTGGNGERFHPGLFARGYVTWDVPSLRAYLYGDGRFTAEDFGTPRLLDLDTGVAIRPFRSLPRFEVRFGNDLTKDIRARTLRDIVYGSLRVNF